MKYQGIYKIRNLINGKVYIGQSSNINKRFDYHKKYASNYYKEHYLYRAFNKYGIENFEFIVIEHINDINKLNEAEQFWMDYYNSYNKDFGYNLRSKAESNRGMKCSKEHKAKVGLRTKENWTKPEYRSNIVNKIRGQKRSEEFCKQRSKISKAIGISEGFKQNQFVKGQEAWNKGKKMSDKHRENTSKASKKLWDDPIYKEKMKEIHRTRKRNKREPFSEEWRKNISKANKGKTPWNKGLKISKVNKEFSTKTI